MAKATVKKATLEKVCLGLEQRYGQRKRELPTEFIETLVYQILELGASEKAATQALERIHEEYIDWNDMRVATIREIQDILGAKYPRCREKAEDLASLLADLYTAFRSTQLDEVAPTPQGVETLRALPETTLIREDMVEQALLVSCRMHTFPCDHDQMEQLRFFKAVPANMAFGDAKFAIEQELDNEMLLRLARGLREHIDFIQQHEEYDPQPISWGWSKECPITKAKPKRVSKPQPKVEKVPYLVAKPPEPEAGDDTGPAATAPAPTAKEEPVADAADARTAGATVVEEAADKPAPASEPTAVSDQGTAADKPVSSKKKAAAKKPASSKKKAAAKKPSSSKKKAAATKPASTRKKAAATKPTSSKKKAAAKKPTSTKKKSAAKKPASTKKKAAAKKPASTKKKAAAKKPTSTKKKSAAKKPASTKKKAAAKKPASTRKKSAAKKAPAKSKKKAAKKRKK